MSAGGRFLAQQRGAFTRDYPEVSAYRRRLEAVALANAAKKEAKKQAIFKILQRDGVLLPAIDKTEGPECGADSSSPAVFPPLLRSHNQSTRLVTALSTTTTPGTSTSGISSGAPMTTPLTPKTAIHESA